MSPGPLVVIGDSLLDIDLDGTSERQCPDAPVPVLDLQSSRLRPGGAGLAALLAARHGSPVQLITGLGQDEAADDLLGLLDGVEVLAQPLHGSTVTKTRIRLGTLPLLRVDTGTGTAGAGRLTTAATRAVERAGALLICDYGRGLARLPQLRQLLVDRSEAIPLIWDPHPRGARPVRGATVVTPNLAEAERAAPDAADDHTRGLDLCRIWSAQAAAVTQGEHGAVLTRIDRPASRHVTVPAELRQAARHSPDTCGAGDRFAAAVAEALRHDSSLEGAVEQAVDQAAGFVVAGGASAHSMLRRERHLATTTSSRDVDVATLIDRTRRAGGRIVATGGCFDLLHRGHVTLLDRARELGDLLVVCLNSDASVRRAKGPGRPVVAERDRARVLASLASVDAVVVFDDDTPAELLEQLRPDIWVKGRDYVDRDLPEADAVTRHGGRVVLLPLLDGYSTTRLVASSQPAPV
ncbi:MAG: D-glycero-beta-D-manno-heptose 1-phosphate adenylyltransferase [Microlunatus sp.]|nr:D-glycero-beta-D-manno-heptose 1-phosphate adenylyltransferase [Microlunatus sp.]